MRFPQNIRLHVCQDHQSNILAGVLIYESTFVAHSQYIAASEEGKQYGALDFLFHSLISDTYSHKQYFDFGISNENQGQYLNVGLISYKEGLVLGALLTISMK